MKLLLLAAGSLALTSCVATVSFDTPDDHRAVLEAWVEMWQKRDLSIADRVLAEDIVRFHQRDDAVRSPADMKTLITQLTTTFPDFAVEVHGIDVDATGGRVRWTVTGTHSGPGMGPPTGRTFAVDGSDSFDIENGKVVRNWGSWDNNSFLAQLGAPRMAPRAYDNLRAVRSWIHDLANEGRLDVIDDLFAADHVLDENGWRSKGHDGMREHILRVRKAFAGFRLELHHSHADADRCSSRWTATGKHTGDFLGIAPTGRDVEVHGLMLTRFRDGKMVESYISWDTNDLFRQLGTTPPATAPTGGR